MTRSLPPTHKGGLVLVAGGEIVLGVGPWDGVEPASERVPRPQIQAPDLRPSNSLAPEVLQPGPD